MPHDFWTQLSPSRDPKMQWRFRVTVKGMGLEDARDLADNGDIYSDIQDESNGVMWYAKTIDKPGYSITDINDGRYLNAGTKANPKTTVDSIKYKPITMTLVDPVYPDATRKLVRILRRSGHNEAQAYAAAMMQGGPHEAYLNSIAGENDGQRRPAPATVLIEQLDERGRPIEEWTLLEAYPLEVDFGKLDYSSNSLVEITIKWGFKTFNVYFPTKGNEREFLYYRDLNGAPEERRGEDGVYWNPPGCAVSGPAGCGHNNLKLVDATAGAVYNNPADYKKRHGCSQRNTLTRGVYER